MAKFRFLQNSFRSGELGPKLLGRADTEQYQEACEELLNFVTMKTGGVTRRMGSKFLYSALDRPAIVPFVFSKSEGYGVLLNHLGDHLTILNQDGSLATTRISTVEMSGKRLDDWSSWIGQYDANGWHHTQTGDVLFLVHSSGEFPPIQITRVEDPDYTPDNEDDHTFYEYEGVVFEVSWYLKPFDLIDDQDRRQLLRWTYQNINIEEKWIRFSAVLANGNYNLNAYREQTATNRDRDFWDEREVGSIIRVVPYENSKPSNLEVAFEIVALVDDDPEPGTSYPRKSSIIEAKVIHPTTIALGPDLQYVTKDWKKSFWSDLNGWPKSVTMFEQRLFFGGSKQFPDTVWGSQSFDVFHMMQERLEQDKGADQETINYAYEDLGNPDHITSTTSEDKTDVSGLNYFGVEKASDPVSFNSGATQVNKIQWIHGSAGLMVGTIGAEYVLTGGSQGLTNDNVFFRRQSAIGSSDAMPTSIDTEVFYVSRTDRNLYEIVTDPDKFLSQSRDLNILNNNIVKHNSSDLQTIEKIVGQSGSSTVWCLTSADALIGFTKEINNNVTAWHRHTIGVCEGVKSIGVVPNETGTYDDLWLSTCNTGLGVKMYLTTPSNVGQDIETFFPTGDAADRVYTIDTPNDPLGTVQSNTNTHRQVYQKRQGIVKFSDDFVGADLQFGRIGLDDESPTRNIKWNIWFNDLAAPAVVGPNVNGTAEQKVDYNATDDRDTIIANIAEAINATRHRVKATSRTSGTLDLGAEPGGGGISHFLKSAFSGNNAFGAKSSFELNLATSGFPGLFADDLFGDFFFAGAVGATDQEYFRFYYDNASAPAGDPDATPVIDKFPILIESGWNATQVINKTAEVIAAATWPSGYSITSLQDQPVWDVETFSPFAAQDGYENIERISESFDHDLMQNTSEREGDKPYFLDSSIRIEIDPASTTVTGLDHLKGETVRVLADGFDVGSKDVDENGQIMLDNPASEVIAGHSYTSRLKTFPLEVGSDYGSGIGATKRIDKATMLFYKTFGPVAGYEEGLLEDLEFIPPDYVVGDPLPLFTGRYNLEFPASPDDLQFVIIEQDKPYPASILAIAVRGRVNDGSQ